jgi:hypothetical protein
MMIVQQRPVSNDREDRPSARAPGGMTAVRARGPVEQRQDKCRSRRGGSEVPEMNTTRAKEGRAPPPPSAAVPDPAVPIPISWLQARECLREIEAHLRLVPENGRDSEAPLRHLVGRMAATLEALRLTDEEAVRRVAERAAELSEANAVLQTVLSATF